MCSVTVLSTSGCVCANYSPCPPRVRPCGGASEPEQQTGPIEKKTADNGPCRAHEAEAPTAVRSSPQYEMYP